MSQLVRDAMTPQPTVVTTDTSLADIAHQMRAKDIGDVLVSTDDTLQGIVSDRDLVVRAVADHRDLSSTTAADICSEDLVTVRPEDTVDDAIQLMRDSAVKRMPVVDEGRPVGVISLGDLALLRDRESPLADVSSALPNR